MWARFFGTGIVEPVDDLRPDNPPSHPELLDLLAREFRSHGYELKFLIRAITATKAYALTSGTGRTELAPANLFATMQVRTLSSGQLFETLAQATGFREGSSGYFTYEGASKARFVELFTNRDEKPTEGETSILQALALMNGPLIANVTSLETSVTLAAVAEAPYLDTQGRIETLFLAALSRRPCPASWRGSSLTSSAAALQVIAPRHLETSSGRCSTVLNSALTTEIDSIWPRLAAPSFLSLTRKNDEPNEPTYLRPIAPSDPAAGRRRRWGFSTPAGSRHWRPTRARTRGGENRASCSG